MKHCRQKGADVKDAQGCLVSFSSFLFSVPLKIINSIMQLQVFVKKIIPLVIWYALIYLLHCDVADTFCSYHLRTTFLH